MYNDRLVKLNIDSLELRRLRLDLIYVYKIMFGLVATDMITSRCNPQMITMQ